MDWFQLKRTVLGTVRGDQFLYISNKFDYKSVFWLLQCFSLDFFPPPPHSSEVPYVIYLSLIDLRPPLVDHPDYYLSACPIRHHLWPSMSWGSQGSTIQGSFPYKCGQKVSCKAFNAVAATFPKIFLSFHPSCMFIMHVPISGTSWNVTLRDRIYIWSRLCLSEERLLVGLSSQSFYLHLTHEILSLIPSLLFIRPWTNQRPRPRPKAQYTISGPYPYNYHNKF